MAYKRKMRTATRLGKRRKYTPRRAWNITRSKRRSTGRGSSLTVKRLVAGNQNLTFSTTATANFWKYITPSLDQGFPQFDVGNSTIITLTNKSEYQALFDNYKLSAFKITIRPRYQMYNINQGSAAAPTAGVDIPYFCIVKDPYSKLVPSGVWTVSTLNTLLENGGKIYRADRPVNIYMKPKVVEQYGVGADRYVSPKFTDLSTAAGTSMPHRGFHLYAFTSQWNSAALPQNAWDVQMTYYLKFKNQR